MFPGSTVPELAMLPTSEGIHYNDAQLNASAVLRDEDRPLPLAVKTIENVIPAAAFTTCSFAPPLFGPCTILNVGTSGHGECPH